MNCSSLDELLNVEFGNVGTATRDEFDRETEAFCLAQTLKEERKRAGLTQGELADKIGTKKTYISRLERVHSLEYLKVLENALVLLFFKRIKCIYIRTRCENIGTFCLFGTII